MIKYYKSRIGSIEIYIIVSRENDIYNLLSILSIYDTDITFDKKVRSRISGNVMSHAIKLESTNNEQRHEIIRNLLYKEVH